MISDISTFFKMPFRRSILVFSVLFFVIVLLVSGYAYYLAMKNLLDDKLQNDLAKVTETTYMKLYSAIDKEVVATQILAYSPLIVDYFEHPENQVYKKEVMKMFNSYFEHLQNKMLSWLSVAEGVYYVNGNWTAKLSASNPSHAWIFRTLNAKKTPLIETGFDYIDKNKYDLYISYPIYADKKVLGFICNRIFLSTFLEKLDLQNNVFVFNKSQDGLGGEEGVVIGAANSKLVQEKKLIGDIFGDDADELLGIANTLNGDSVYQFSLNGFRYAIRNFENYNMFFIAKKSDIGFSDVLQSEMTNLYFILVIELFIVFVVFNIFLHNMRYRLSHATYKNKAESLIDELTQLNNRKAFNMHIREEWNLAVQNVNPISFFMIDLDFFSNYKRTHGHEDGDILLREVTGVLIANLTSVNFISRLSEDQFAVILPNTNINNAVKIAEHIRLQVEGKGKITVSIGIANSTPIENDSFQEFINSADKNLSRAKKSGKNMVIWKESGITRQIEIPS